MRRVRALVELDRALEAHLGLLAARAGPRNGPGALVQLRLHESVVAETGRALERPLRLRGRGERRGPLAGADQHLARPVADLRGVGRVRGRLERVDEVLGDDLDDLVLVTARAA